VTKILTQLCDLVAKTVGIIETAMNRHLEICAGLSARS
jgi:hypothetical protein